MQILRTYLILRFAVVKEDEQTNQNNRITSIMSKPSVRTKEAIQLILFEEPELFPVTLL